MLKIKNIYVLLLVLLAGLLTSVPAFADNNTTTTTSITSLINPQDATSTASSTLPQVLGLQAPTIPPIIAAIKQAKLLLAPIQLNHSLSAVYKKNTKKIIKYNLGDKDIVLAILDPASNNTIITKGRLNGKSMVFPDPSVDVQLVKFNGVNSKFQINRPANGTVVALKYLISGAESGSKKAIENGLYEAVYVPSSPALGQPDVIAYGQNYLDGIIKRVVFELQGLPSQAIPGETVTQAIPPAMIKSLIYAEHSDTTSVLNGNAQDALNSLNIILATNEGDAYKYSVSNDGYASRGIAQFVKSTYDSLVQRHPEANLISNYVAAMEDHENSIKAMYLLLDDYAGAVRIKAADGFVASRVFDYGAASYNAGTSRVANAVKIYGANWSLDRTAQVNSLQSQVNSFSSQAKLLKAKIKKTTDKKARAALQSQLATAQANLSSASDQLKTLDASSLKNTTVNYLAKIYKVIQYFNGQQLAINE